MKEQPSKGVLGIPQAFLTLPGACHYCKHDVLTPWGSSLLWQFFPNDSGYETRFVIPLTSDLYSFFFLFWSINTLQWYISFCCTMVRWLIIFSLYFLSYSKKKKKIWTKREWLNSIVRDRMSVSVKEGNVSQSGDMFWRTDEGSQTSMEK